MRVLGIDLGQRRVGLAISDPSGTLARPLTTLTLSHPSDALECISVEIAKLLSDEDGLGSVVVGLPRGLDGTPTPATLRTTAFIDALRAHIPVPVVGAEERLSSREAESRLAVRQRDWRKRKPRLDAAAAAVILQDYLDQRDRLARQRTFEDPPLQEN